MSEWLKVSPSGANKIFVTEADADSPTGYSAVEKTVAQMKTLLGLPTRYVALTASLVNVADTTFLQTISQKFYTETFTITIAKNGTGVYNVYFNDEWGSVSDWANSRKFIQPIYDNLINNLPTDYTMEVDASTSNYIILRFKESGVAAEIPTNDQIVVDIRVEY